MGGLVDDCQNVVGDTMRNGEPVQFLQDMGDVVILTYLLCEASCAVKAHLELVMLLFGDTKVNG